MRLRQVKGRDGIFAAEQIRRAIDLWIAKTCVRSNPAKGVGHRAPR